MDIYSSTRDLAEEHEIESFDQLFCDLKGRLRRIWAISAYYDADSIHTLLNHIRENGNRSANNELIIIVDQYAGNIEELQSIDEHIRSQPGLSTSSGIYVAKTSGGIFHSKGYLAETGNEGELYIGSMNLTKKGISANEELLTYFSYTIDSKEQSAKMAQKFKSYVLYLIETKCQRVSDIECRTSKEANDLRSLFLNGCRNPAEPASKKAYRLFSPFKGCFTIGVDCFIITVPCLVYGLVGWGTDSPLRYSYAASVCLPCSQLSSSEIFQRTQRGPSCTGLGNAVSGSLIQR